MSSRGHHLVAVLGDTVLVRVVGLGDMNNSVSLKLFLDPDRNTMFRECVFDLSECDGFDSTFMGILLGLQLKGMRVGLGNVSSEQRRLLGEVGLDQVVQLMEEPLDFPDIEMERFDGRSVGERERTRQITHAHENLARHSPENAQRFARFLDMLKAELGDS